jgi:hypothetical protein
MIISFAASGRLLVRPGRELVCPRIQIKLLPGRGDKVGGRKEGMIFPF